MNFKISVKKLACFLLAALMLLATVGCSEGTTKKRVVKKKVVIVNEPVVDDTSSDDEPIADDTDDDEYEVPRAQRPLPLVDEEEEYVEPIVPEFTSSYVDFDLTSDYVIVYAVDTWTGRYEGKSNGGNGDPIAITTTANNRVSANNLKTFIKDNYNLNLEVVKDTDPKATAATKKILVGDTAFYKSSLAENDFAVKVSGNNLIFEGGHFAMVENAVKWFKTVEVQDGKVAILDGIESDFKSTVTLDNGITYTYVWGDEHSGEEVFDSNKWQQTAHKDDAGDDLSNVFNDTHFNAVENGKMRLTGDRYYDETDALVGYAMSGSTQTDNAMLFRNGYVEFRARLPYTRGAFPAIWSLSTRNELETSVPNYTVNDGYGVYKNRVWNIEFDLFESFADTTFMTTTVHKWYMSIDNYKAATEDSLATANIWLEWGDGTKFDVYNSLKYPNYNLNSSIYTVAYSSAYSYDWKYYFPNPENLNNEYHTYAYLYTSEGTSVYIDGNKFLEFDWDPAYDYIDNIDVSRNNNGVGYNFWHYLIYDMMLYTPAKYPNLEYSKVLTPEDCPLNMYVDYVRIYQDLSDPSMALCYPAAQE